MSGYRPKPGGYRWREELEFLKGHLDGIVERLGPLAQAARNEETLRVIYEALELCYRCQRIVGELRGYRE